MKLVQVSNSLELEDAKLISELKIQNDEVVGLCYRKEGAEGVCACTALAPLSLPLGAAAHT